MTTRQKIFCIGFHKTGTRSLTQALRKLGIKASHWPYKYLGQLAPDASKEEVLKVLAPVLEANQSFADVPYSGLYRDLDRLFPGSKFILTKRSSENWWDSISRHWSLSEGTRTLTPYEHIQYNQFPPAVSEATMADEALLTNKFEAHNRTVSAYFEQRSEDLLVIDWESESHPFSWERLCSFLNVDMPKDTSVPWIRKGGISEVKI